MTKTSSEKAAVRPLIEDWAHRAHVFSLIQLMKDEGYATRTINTATSVISAFISWKSDHKSGASETLAFEDFDQFIAKHAAAGKLRNSERRALMRLREQLVRASVVPHPIAIIHPIDNVLALYKGALCRRGYALRSIASHLWFGRKFLSALWDHDAGLSRATHEDIRSYLAHRFEHSSGGTANTMCSQLRSLLRFAHSAGLTASDLAMAVPSVRNLRSATLPSFMTSDQLKRVLGVCDRTTTVGRRDYAILLLLARLGLRASEVACITLDDIDWRAGILRVKRKGGWETTMPMPHDVGEALSDYILRGRPVSDSRIIFHRVETPCKPFRSSAPVILVAHRVLNRAGITGLRSHHAHVFRHTFATNAMRSGASLAEVGQVLGHKGPDTTRIYAKVDFESLRSLARPWAGEVL